MDRKELEAQVVSLYLSGASCSNIARELSIQRKSVYRILDRKSITLNELHKNKCVLCEKEIVQYDKRKRNRCGTCNTSVRRYRVKKKCVEYKGNQCVRCNWSGDISGFDFHHRDPLEKELNLTAAIMASMKWEDIKLELDKCELLCALCHRLEHSNYKDEKFLSEVNSV